MTSSLALLYFKKIYPLSFFISISLLGQIPNGYYDTANEKAGADLKTALYNKIKGHTVQTYSPGVWNAYYTTDVKANGKVWDMYSNCDFVFGTSGNQDNGTLGTSECQKYNREHSFPKSWFGISSPSTSSPPSTDLFHVIPTDKYVNGKRGNMPYGEVGSSVQYTFGNETKIGVCSFPGYSGTVFEPIDEYKGDMARGYFYMATRYQDVIKGWEKLDANGDVVLKNDSIVVFEDWYLNLLFKWHTQDPVSDKEINRNNAIYAIQGNRNPFIDHPEYANLIWDITVTGSNNHAPIATNFTLTGWQNYTVTSSLLGKYSDADDDSLTITSFTNIDTKHNGKASIDSSGLLTYTPAIDFFGLDTLHYQVCDSALCTSGTIVLRIKQAPPILLSHTYVIKRNLAFTGSIDSLVNNQKNGIISIQSQLITSIGGSTFQLKSNGDFTYIPKVGFTGSESFPFSVCNTDTCNAALLIFSIPGISTGIHSFEESVTLYPQPAINELIINSLSREIQSLFVSNVIGERVLEYKTPNTKSLILDLSQLNSGAYFLTLTFENYTVTKRLFLSK